METIIPMEKLWKYPPFVGLQVKKLNHNDDIWTITDTQGEPPIDWKNINGHTWNVTIKNNKNGSIISSYIQELIPLPHNRIPVGHPIQLIENTDHYTKIKNIYGITTGYLIKHCNIPNIHMLLGDSMKVLTVNEKYVEPIPNKPIIKFHYYHLSNGEIYYIKEGETNTLLDECIINFKKRIHSHAII